MIAIALKDFKLYCKNFNFLVEKNMIQFKSHTQKIDIDRYLLYIICLFFYVTLTIIFI